MKKKHKIALCIVALISAALIFIGCERIFIFSGGNATLTFIFGDKHIVQTLTEEETKTVKELFSGKPSSFFELPACPFDENISISFGSQTFAIAGDDCDTVKDWGMNRYFDIGPEGKEYIKALFEKYGGYFPCC